MINIGKRTGLKELFYRIKYVLGIARKKPKFLFRSLGIYLRVKLSSYLPPKYMDFAFDYTCNFACKGCFAEAFSHQKRPKMTLDDYKRVIQEAHDIGCFYFNFQGGEPLHPNVIGKLEQLINMSHPEQNMISISTNAYFLDEKMAQRLKNLKVDHVIISLDSGIPEEHDKYRGVKGAFEHAKNGIDNCLKKGIRVSVNTVMSPNLLYSEGLTKLLDFCEKRNVSINAVFPTPTGRWEGNEDIMLKQKDIEYFKEVRSKHPILRRDEDGSLKRWGCGAGKEVLHITHFGDVLPCAFLHISYGNVIKEPLSVIHKRIKDTKTFGPNTWTTCWLANETFAKQYVKTVCDNEKPVDYRKVKWLR
jgi:MoaA/NifB/PqqE/SkfB family radical SAM enzyme